jgi:uncharacterized protein YbjT (DUF2867 family)
MHIVMAGATGLVGGFVLRQLEARNDVSSIKLLTRRAIPVLSTKVDQRIGDVAAWPDLLAGAQADVVISTLGTTLRAAGSKDAFYAVDHDAVVNFARASRAAGARQFMMVSSVGAKAASRNFYLSTKGRTEEAVAALGFARLDIFSPGLLRGDRGGPVRIGERVGMLVSPFTDRLTPRSLDRYRSIAAGDVAAAITKMAGALAEGAFTHNNRAMWTAISVS